MKSVILLKMRLWVFLTEIPLIILLLVCKNVNEGMEELFGLWPLMIALGALIVFLAVYFFRLVSVSWEEITDIGLFTRKDSSIIDAGKALVITLAPKGPIKLTLLGKVGEDALFDWTSEEDRDVEIALYRGNAYGGRRAAKRLLTYFGAAEGDIDAILGGEDVSIGYLYSAVRASTTGAGREIRIEINETLLANGTPLTKPSVKKSAPADAEAGGGAL